MVVIFNEEIRKDEKSSSRTQLTRQPKTFNLDYEERPLKDTRQYAEKLIIAYVDLTRKHKVPSTPY